MGKQRPGSENPLIKRVRLYTKERKEVLFRRKVIFLRERQGSKGSASQTEIHYFSIPGNKEDKHLVTLTQILNEQYLVLTKDSKVLTTCLMSLEDFTNKKNDIEKELERSGTGDTNIAQSYLFVPHVESDGTVRFQSFDKNYYLSGSKQLDLEQSQDNGAGLRFCLEEMPLL